MADTSFSDSTSTTAGTSIVAAFLNVLNKLAYWGRNPIYVTSGGSANAQTITLPATSLYSALAAGDSFTFKAGFTNTSSMTIQIIGASSLTAKSLKNPDGSNPRAGQITAGGIYTVVYEATADVFVATSLPGSMTGTGAMAFATSPTFVTPTLGVASATSLATSAASPLLMTNGQLTTVALTSQTIGGVTLTIPDFAGVADEFTFKTKSQTLSNKTFVAPVLGVATATSIALSGGDALSSYLSSTFTGSLTGCTTVPTSTIYYTKIGSMVMLSAPLSGNLSATSNSTSKTITGMPAAIRPTRSQRIMGIAVSDNGGANALTYADISTGGVIDISMSLNASAWTAAGTATITGFTTCYSVA